MTVHLEQPLDVVGLLSGLVVFAVKLSISCALVVSMFYTKVFFLYLQQNGAQLVKKVNGIFCFKVKSSDKEATWVVDLKTGNGTVKLDPQGIYLHA